VQKGRLCNDNGDWNCGDFEKITPNQRKIPSPFGLSRCARTKRQEGRQEEKSQKVIIPQMLGGTLSRQNSTKLGNCVHLADVIKWAKFHQNNLRGIGAVRCQNFHVAIGKPITLHNTLLCTTMQQVTKKIMKLGVHRVTTTQLRKI